MLLPPPNPNDKLLTSERLPNTAVVDFWQWAYGDLMEDTVKGVFAEWIVHKLLGVHSPRRVSWANSDVITPTGVRFEIKSTAFWQSWKLRNERGNIEVKPKHSTPLDDRKIRFQGLKARDSTSPAFSDPRTFKSHFYIFAFQNERNPSNWNALDLAQWEFYLVNVTELERLGWASISLATLRSKFQCLSAPELSEAGRKAIADNVATDA